ncbi:hypothetical protein F5878DRAFT_100608 [Lentinula raphanica]|uniref:DH domain-containing protein n=1 Tax=Lentinula raphanica TaxID=153919 RepID=A0AA38UFP1_9AGAR|nr:hypothetical protein F5878DRAFT_100608 [Lentinula raphanica]
MKAFFSRLHLGGGSGTVSSSSSSSKEMREKEIGKLPPLKTWPPQPSAEMPQAQKMARRTDSQESSMTTGTGVGKRASATGSGSGYAVYKPLPSPIPAESGPDDVVDDSQRGDNDEDTRSDSTATPTPTPSARTPTPTAGPTDEHASATATPVHRKHTAGSLNTNIVGDVQKKVAFLSPTSPSPSPAPLESIHENSNNLNPSQQSLRSGTPYSQMSGVSQYSSMTSTSTAASGSRILSATSWSEVTEEDLVLNLGSRERTRQEVLFEIISSEERYVGELAKMKEMFIEPLLHPYYPRRVLSPEPLSVTETPEQIPPKPSSPLSSRSDSLPPIAARFMSPTPQNEMLEEGDDSGDDLMDDDEEDEAARKERQKKNVHPRSPYRASASQKKTIIPFPSASGARSHQSLPPPPHGNQQSRSGNNPNAVSTQSLGRQSIGVERERERERERSQSQSQGRSSSAAKGMFKKLRTSTNNNNSNQDPFDTNNPNALPLPIIPPHLLPPDLRICLEVIDSGVFEGHKRLAEALRKRYDDQYPLVRSLADVFVANSDIFQGYATYVLHLERALDQVDNAINDMSPPHPPSSKSTSFSSYTSPKSTSKSPSSLSKPTFSSSSRSTSTTTANISSKSSSLDSLHQKSLIPTLLRTLDTLSSYSGQTSLSISLSKPFQRLLKYPLLFQNLLYNTDPSTTEYESTLQLVAEIEVMVRGIEDEKVEWEDRERTRDALGRIEWGDGNGDSGGGLSSGFGRSRGPKGTKAGKGAGMGWVGRPKPGRVLIEETVYTPPADELPSTNGNGGATSPPPPPPSAFNTPIQTKKSKSSFRRLSDALSPSPPSSKTGIGIGGSTGKQVKPFGKKDLWLVVFNDVVLLCQRTGVTTVPIWSSGGENLTKGGGDKEKDKAGMGKRQIRAKPRNLYKFLKVETWVMEDIVREGVVTMADISRTRIQPQHATPAHSPQQLSNQPRIIPMPADDERPGLTSSARITTNSSSSSYSINMIGNGHGNDPDDSDADSSDSDRKSKMSFSYWGADKVTVQRPVGLSSPSGAGTGGSTTSLGSNGGRGGTKVKKTVIRGRGGGLGPGLGRGRMLGPGGTGSSRALNSTSTSTPTSSTSTSSATPASYRPSQGFYGAGGGAPQGRVVVPSRKAGYSVGPSPLGLHGHHGGGHGHRNGNGHAEGSAHGHGQGSAHGHAVLTPSAYSRESSANAKFGTRLVSDREKEREREREKEKSERSEKERAASRRTVGTTGSTATSKDTNSNSLSAPRMTPSTSARSRSTSQTSRGTLSASANKNQSQVPPSPSLASPNPSSSTPVPGPISVAPSRSRESTSTSTSASASAAGKASGVLGTSTPVSPAPSEDSGVGLNLYRQIQVQGLVKD